MRLGVLGYTTRRSGLGGFFYDILRNCQPDSWLSVQGAKGQEQWLERQVNCAKPSPEVLDAYLSRYRPEVLLMVETPFNDEVWSICRSRHVKTALVVMQEFYRPGLEPDLFICPTRIAYDRLPERNRAYFDWPIDCEPFDWHQRREARRFLHVAGYDVGGVRRQTGAVLDGFKTVRNRNLSLTIHSQQPWTGLVKTVAADKRVSVRVQNYDDPQQVYAGFDVLIQPDAWAGYNRLLSEAKATGMIVLTTDTPPMNELVTDPLALIPGKPQSHHIGGLYKTTRTVVDPADVATAIRRVLTWDIPAKSLRARKCALKHGWSNDRRADFARLLEALWNR